jgi:membrane peptidoglycan carboxypeptidase
MASVRRLALNLAVLFLCPAIAYYAFVMAQAYHEAPKLAAAIDRSGRLALGLEDLPPGYVDILLAVEDPRFYSHPGVDLVTPGAGFTTITQALVKQLFFDGFRPGPLGLGKLRQSLIALVFDARVSKRDQLRIFVNTVYLGSCDGRPVEGMAEAARSYFGKDPSALARTEYLCLVAMIIGPNEFHVRNHPRENADRVRRIERLLRGDCRPVGLWDVYYRACG